MIIKIQDNNKKIELDVDLDELKGWLNIDFIDGESNEELQKRIQHEINEEFNKDEYNNWHQHNRHIGYSKAVSEDGEDLFGHFREPLVEEVKDSRIFCRDEIERERKEEYERCCKFLLQHIKKQELAELFIKVIFEDYTLRELAMFQNPREEGTSEKEYKQLIAKIENNLSHKLVRVRKKLKRIMLETSDFDVPRGYLVEDDDFSRNL
ncbi:hypothetical protein NHG29_00140 [Aerococcaceae bacterium NML160702]|nr:hypothetical protein [Aerococcaceae bacterium NML160702]